MRWQYRDPVLVWLVVAAFAAHVVEEYLASFPGWFAQLSGRPLPVAAFLWINGVALPAIVVITWAGLRRGWDWIPIALGTIVLVNGVGHLLGSLATGTYSPGLLTGIMLYLPLGQLLLIRAWHQASGTTLATGILSGIVAHMGVTLTAVAVSLR